MSDRGMGDEERAPLFGDEDPDAAEGIERIERVEEAGTDESESLSFGDSDTGPLPHWTEPASGDMPRIAERELAAAEQAGEDADASDDLDVWSSFSSDAPVWKDDPPADAPGPDDATDASGEHVRITGRHQVVPPPGGDATGREPSRISIGTDPSGMPRRPAPAPGRRRGARPAGGNSGAGAAPTGGRDLPAAVAVGILLAAVFVAALMWRPIAAVAFVTLVIGLAGVEFFDKVSEKGYRPAVIPGLATIVSAPIAAYWVGERALPLVLAFGFLAITGSFIGARGVEAGPMPNAAITTLGVVWIGLLGSFAALIIKLSTIPGSSSVPGAQNWGTDTIFLLALAVVANDVGAYFVGSAAGRTPLRAWVSPGKTVEGFIGGTVLTIVVLVVVGTMEMSDTWTSTTDLLILAVIVSVLAPMGDLVESMFKRNLDVKDFGSIVKGHGGVLDRFDGFLFVLPVGYYMTLVIEPWAA